MTDSPASCILEPVESLKVERPELADKAFRQNWARLIQKVYPVKFPKGNLIKQGK